MSTGAMSWIDGQIARVLPHLDPPKPHERLLLLAAALAAVLLATVGTVALFAGITGDVGEETQARTDCREFVEAELRSPASAEFSDERVSSDGDTYVVSGTVDADNAFGASLRNEYRCEVEVSGDSSRLVRLSGLG